MRRFRYLPYGKPLKVAGLGYYRLLAHMDEPLTQPDTQEPLGRAPQPLPRFTGHPDGLHRHLQHPCITVTPDEETWAQIGWNIAIM